MWFLASLLLLLPLARAGVCPSTVDPVFSLTFSQEGCRNGQFTTDDGVFHVPRSVASTTCVHSPALGFNYTMPGVQITNPNDFRALESLFYVMDTPLAYHDANGVGYTIEFWITRTSVLGGWESIVEFSSTEDMTRSLHLYGTDAQVHMERINPYYLFPSSLYPYTSMEFQRSYPARHNVSVSDFSGSGKYTDWTSDLHTPIYMALVFEPKTIPDKYRSGLQNSDRGFHSFCTLYFGNLQRNNLYRIWDDLGSDLSLGRDSIQANDRLRFGTTVAGGGYTSAQSAILQQFSWFSKALSLSEVQARFATSFPNALPVVKDVWLTFLQQQFASLAVLNTSAVVYDANNDTITGFQLLSLPSRGGLYYNGTRLRIQPVNLTSITLLAYNSENVGEYTLATGGICTNTSVYTTFSYRAIDAKGGISPFSATASICILDVQDVPILPPSVVSVPIGAMVSFTLFPIDGDDFKMPVSLYRLHDSPTLYTPGARVQFASTVGTYGQLTSCSDGSLLLPNLDYAPLNSQAFTFCYSSFRTDPTVYGKNDTFSVDVKDGAGGVSTSSLVTFTLAYPLLVCPSVMLNCSAVGNEFPSITGLTLDALDTFGGRPLFVKVTTLPKNGTLYYATGNGTVVYNDTSLWIPWISGVAPFSYLPTSHFFTRKGRTGYTTVFGKGWNDCPILQDPGCPEVITYSVWTPVGNQTSTMDGTFTIQIEQNFSSLSPPVLPTISVPVIINMASSIPLQLGMNEDQDEYKVGITLYTTRGVLAMNLSAEEERQPGVTFMACYGYLEFGCQQISLYGYPTVVNRVLDKLTLYVENPSTISLTGTIKVQLFKPLPAGMTDLNAYAVVAGNVPDYQEYIAFNLVTSAGATGGGSATTATSDTINPLYISLIVVLVLGSVLCVTCIFTRWLNICRKRSKPDEEGSSKPATRAVHNGGGRYPRQGEYTQLFQRGPRGGGNYGDYGDYH